MPAAPALAQVQPYRANDFGDFQDVLPPGTDGSANLVELAAFLGTGARPAHNDDQRGMYARLLSATPGVSAKTIGGLFKDASFGVAPGDQARAYSPRDGLTITRDASFGVPHVYGATRSAAMFGLGYIAAEDRLFFIDVLRHAGRVVRGIDLQLAPLGAEAVVEAVDLRLEVGLGVGRLAPLVLVHVAVAGRAAGK